ncbi:GIY-YIG nuclease family protein [uncultured Paraglaciecola sp.]|uniref:GIY-YIG nuclease family protein n=1 Tax=uncultured Paraglaciecola sp. TaxID=1765024 RepID=UPI00260E914D|nr:GIY-YIG nuclease family protein [uncultured Paraglaciecola sp.]
MHHDPTFDSLSDQEELERLVTKPSRVTELDMAEATPLARRVYRDHLELEVARIKGLLKLLDESSCGWVYLITDGDYVKIGWSTTISERIDNLQVANAKPLHLILCIGASSRKTESLVQEAFSHKHKYGEWYELEPSDIAILREEMDSDIVECGFEVPRNRLADLVSQGEEPRSMNSVQKRALYAERSARKTHVKW